MKIQNIKKTKFYDDSRYNKLPKELLPKGTKVKFVYRSDKYINIVSIDKEKVTYFLWDGESMAPTHVLNFPIINLTN